MAKKKSTTAPPAPPDAPATSNAAAIPNAPATPKPAAAETLETLLETARAAFSGVTVGTQTAASEVALGEKLGAAMIDAAGPNAVEQMTNVLTALMDELPKMDALDPAALVPAVEPEDVANGLRFSHVVEMQTKQRLSEVAAELSALRNALVAEGVINAQAVARHAPAAEAQERARAAADVLVVLNEVEDKYALTNLPEIDCEARLPLCKARCCTFTFALATQDLDERVIRWDYGRPYQIARRSDGYCVHNLPAGAGEHLCGVHEARPASCRLYDCRNDQRIWIDFEKRIPAK